MPKTGGCHKNSSRIGEVKKYVLKPPKLTTLQNDQNINFKHLRPDVAFLLAPKMMGHVFPLSFCKSWESSGKANPHSQLQVQ